MKRAAPGRAEVVPEQKFRKKKNYPDSVDWIMADTTATLFVECKAKRVTEEARTSATTNDAVARDLTALAKAVYQAYRGIHDSRMGLYPHWQSRHTPSYPVVVTIEDWHTSLPQIHQDLERLVREWFILKKLPLELLDERRCLLCSADEFERLAQVIGVLGIEAVMKRLTEPNAPDRVAGGLETLFTTERIPTRNFFPEEFERLSPSIDPEELTAAAREPRTTKP